MFETAFGTEVTPLEYEEFFAGLGNAFKSVISAPGRLAQQAAPVAATALQGGLKGAGDRFTDRLKMSRISVRIRRVTWSERTPVRRGSLEPVLRQSDRRALQRHPARQRITSPGVTSGRIRTPPIAGPSVTLSTATTARNFPARRKTVTDRGPSSSPPQSGQAPLTRAAPTPSYLHPSDRPSPPARAQSPGNRECHAGQCRAAASITRAGGGAVGVGTRS